MSFGFSVGDLIGAANLTYRLIKALHGSQDAGEDYRSAINELGCVQQAFIRVSCLGASKEFPRATFESASCIIMGAMDIIQSYLDKTKKYDRRLGGFGASGLAQSFRKVGWTLFKAEDMKKLRETLHARLSALGVLLAAANLDTDMSTTKYLEPAEKGKDLPNMQGSENEALPESQVPSQKSKSTHTKDTKGNAAEIAIKNIKEPLAQLEQTVQELPPSTTIPPALFALSSFPPDELIALITSGVRRAEKIRELCELLRTLVCMGEYQLGSDDHRQFMESLDVICGGKVESTTKLNTPKAPIEFKDAVGRKFSFPWHLCKTWKGMEELIKQAFLHVDVIGPHVHEGHYDLVGPDGEIILPQVWETMIQPDWAITMHMWPMPEPPKKESSEGAPASPPPSPPPLRTETGRYNAPGLTKSGIRSRNMKRRKTAAKSNKVNKIAGPIPIGSESSGLYSQPSSSTLSVTNSTNTSPADTNESPASTAPSIQHYLVNESPSQFMKGAEAGQMTDTMSPIQAERSEGEWTDE